MNLNTHAGTEHVVVRDEEYRHRAVHWGDLHRLLYQALPEGTVRWGHEVLSFRQTTADVDRHRVYVTVRSSRKSEGNLSSLEYVEEIEGDLLICRWGHVTNQADIPST